MADDLASRISDGAVAVLELVPGERRFADLSSFVLRGGAARFAAVLLQEERVRYVLPVGVPGTTLDYGTLLIQKSRCSLVWRSDPRSPYRALMCDLDPATTVTLSPATVRGEVWGRFDLGREGTPGMTFLVPPVAAPALPRMLYRVLIDEPGCSVGSSHVEPLAPGVLEAADMDAALPGTDPFMPLSAESAPTAVFTALATSTWGPTTGRIPTSGQPGQPGRTSRGAMSGNSATEAAARDEGLYRDAVRVLPTHDRETGPAILAGLPPGSRSVSIVRDAPAGVMSDFMKGFFSSFVVTMVIGAMFVLGKAMGWLG